MGRVWEWCLKYLPEDRTSRYLVVTVIVSVVFHILIGVGLIVGGDIEQRKMIAKRGEALLVDMAPDKPKESAPLGNPSRPVGPDAPEPPRQAAPTTPPVPPAPKASPAPPAPAAPRVAEAPKAAPKAPSAAPKSADPGPAPKAAPPAPAPDQSQTAKPAPQTPAAQPQLAAQPQPAADPRVASAPPQPPPGAGMWRGGGGLKGGRGGIEGEPIPLDTPDPAYQDYFNEIRKRIQRNFVYPYEAAIRNIGGELSIEFGIAKSGKLQFIERRRSSGVEILDDYARRAIELASPFPPVPDAISKTGVPIIGTFIYISVNPNSTSIRNYLR